MLFISPSQQSNLELPAGQLLDPHTRSPAQSES